jgi:predicted transcriptional regulator
MSSEVALRDGLYGLEYREEDLRRKPLGMKKTYNIKQFWQRHHEIVNLAAQGFKQTDIADILHIDPQTVSNTLNSELGEEKLSQLREIRDGDAKKRVEQIRVLAEKALGIYHEILDNETGAATLKEQKEVADTVLLDLAGMKSPTKIQSVSTIITADQLAEFKERGIKAAKEAGLVIEVVPEEQDSESNSQ